VSLISSEAMMRTCVILACAFACQREQSQSQRTPATTFDSLSVLHFEGQALTRKAEAQKVAFSSLEEIDALQVVVHNLETGTRIEAPRLRGNLLDSTADALEPVRVQLDAETTLVAARARLDSNSTATGDAGIVVSSDAGTLTATSFQIDTHTQNAQFDNVSTSISATEATR
jgi:hypothetical protein